MSQRQYSGSFCAPSYLYIEKKLHPETTRSAKSRGYAARWRRFRKMYLAAHPGCVKCLEEGRYVKATVIDHIHPFRGDEKLKLIFSLYAKSIMMKKPENTIVIRCTSIDPSTAMGVF